MKTLGLTFRLDDLTAEGRAFEGELPQADLAAALSGMVGELGYRLEGPARVFGTAYRSSGHEVVVDGTFKVKVGFGCVRCLSDRSLEVSARSDHVLVRKSAAAAETAEEDDVLEGEPDLGPEEHTFEGEDIDLAPIFREEVILEMPMNPACEHVGETCVPLTVEGQGAQDAVDPRWAPLLELKKKLT